MAVTKVAVRVGFFSLLGVFNGNTGNQAQTSASTTRRHNASLLPVPLAGYSLLHPSVRLEHGSDITVLLNICTLPPVTG